MNDKFDEDVSKRPFDVDLNSSHKIDVKTSPIVNTSKTIENGDYITRQDKKVIVEDNQGKQRVTSSILLGYNVDSKGQVKIELSDGTYISSEDFAKAVQERISVLDEKETVVCKSTGETLTSDLLEKIVEICAESGKITLAESRKITNQTAKSVEVQGKNNDTPKKSGSMMLGNDGFQLPNGDYVSQEELLIAMADFQIVKETEKVVPVINSKPPTHILNNAEKPKKVTKRDKINKRLLPILMIPVVLLGFGKNKKDIQSETPTLTAIVQEIANSNGSENITEEMIEAALNEIKIGDKVFAPEGVAVHESSDYEYGGANKTGIIGDKYIPAGKYGVNYVSIINPDTGEIVKVESKEGKSLLDTLQEASIKTGVPISDLEGKIHIDDPTAGWIDVNLDLIREQQVTKENLEASILDLKTYDITEKGSDVRDDKFIVDGGIELSSKNLNDLSFVSEGDVLQGNDGKDYIVSDINVGTDFEKVGEETTINFSTTNIKRNLNALKEKVAEEILNVSSYINKVNTNEIGGNTK